MTQHTDGLLTLEINTLDDEDYDGNPVQIKTADATIDGERVAINYSYPGTDVDADIQTAVKADLTDRGYTW